MRLEGQLGAFSLQVEMATERDTGVVAITGPSGSGKTSLLRGIAGLWRPRAGHVAVGDRVLFDAETGVCLPPHQRRLGVVFQDSRLFPHLTVRQNLTYGRRDGGLSLADVVSLLGIQGLLDRRPAALSGGERQRVAMGRALLTHPDLLLLDEPLANLDAPRKRELLPFLAALPRALSVPIVLISHSLDDILQLADELVVLRDGRVAAQGPVTQAAAAALGQGDGLDAVLEGDLVEDDGRRVRLVGGVKLHVLGVDRLPLGARVRMRIPADDVMLGLEADTGPLSVRNRLPATVVSVRPAPRGHVVTLALPGGARLVSRVSAASVRELGLTQGRAVVAFVKAASVRVPGGG